MMKVWVRSLHFLGALGSVIILLAGLSKVEAAGDQILPSSQVRAQLKTIETQAMALNLATRSEKALIMFPERHDRQSRIDDILSRCEAFQKPLAQFAAMLSLSPWPKEFKHLQEACRSFDVAIANRLTRADLLEVVEDLAMISNYLTSSDFLSYYQSKIRMLETQGKLKRETPPASPRSSSFDSEFEWGVQ